MLHAAACAVLLYGYLAFCDVRALPWVARVEVFVAPLSLAVLLGLTAFAVGVVARALLSPSRWKLTLAAPSVICAVELGVCRSAGRTDKRTSVTSPSSCLLATSLADQPSRASSRSARYLSLETWVVLPTRYPLRSAAALRFELARLAANGLHSLP